MLPQPVITHCPVITLNIGILLGVANAGLYSAELLMTSVSGWYILAHYMHCVAASFSFHSMSCSRVLITRFTGRVQNGV